MASHYHLSGSASSGLSMQSSMWGAARIACLSLRQRRVFLRFVFQAHQAPLVPDCKPWEAPKSDQVRCKEGGITICRSQNLQILFLAEIADEAPLAL